MRRPATPTPATALTSPSPSNIRLTVGGEPEAGAASFEVPRKSLSAGESKPLQRPLAALASDTALRDPDDGFDPSSPAVPGSAEGVTESAKTDVPEGRTTEPRSLVPGTTRSPPAATPRSPLRPSPPSPPSAVPEVVCEPPAESAAPPTWRVCAGDVDPSVDAGEGPSIVKLAAVPPSGAPGAEATTV
jgi:hypothetical protein